MIPSYSEPLPWPYSNAKEPSPEDWGIGGTLCLASICRGRRIVGICDAMLSNQEWSGDRMAMKAKPLINDWCVMTAGDPSAAVPILRDVEDRLIAMGDKQRATLGSTVQAFKEAFAVRIKEQAELILLPFGMTLQNYHQIGPPLGQTFQKVLFDITNLSMGATFLAFGFDDEKEAHIFTIEDQGNVKYFDLAGFWAIGSGSPAALGSLFNNSHSRFASYHQTVKNLCEAKFAAEAAPGVGKESFLVVLEVDPNHDKHLTVRDLSPIRKTYEKRKKRMPTKAERKAVMDVVNSLKQERPTPEVATAPASLPAAASATPPSRQ
jgi:hypothetical protein